MVQCQFTLSVPSCRGLDQGILVCISCSLVFLWPQAHQITAVTPFPLQRILRNPEATGRIVEWELELSSFDLKFESTSTIRSRALAEFIAEWTPMPDKEIQETSLPGKETVDDWIMYFDDAFTLQGTGAGVLLVAPIGEHLKYVVQMHFPRGRPPTTLLSTKDCLPVCALQSTLVSGN
jgi:hypothetical protein